MDTVKNATQVWEAVTAEIKRLQDDPDLDPLQRGRVLAQLWSVAMQAIAVCQANWKACNDWHMRQALKQMP